MNILTDRLPETIVVDDVEFRINSDFKSILRTVMAFEDRELTDVEKQGILLANVYKEIPENTKDALLQAALFINGNEQSDKDTESQPKYYSFSKDSKLIFAAFKHVHGIDLNTTSMHWWVFCALFVGLFGSETPFGSLVGLRMRVRNGTATKEEKRAARRMGDAFVIEEDDDRTPEEKAREEEFMRLVRGK